MLQVAMSLLILANLMYKIIHYYLKAYDAKQMSICSRKKGGILDMIKS